MLAVLKQQKQAFTGALGKSCSEKIKQIYRRTSITKCYFNKVASIKFNKVEITPRHGFSPVNLMHYFRTPFYKNTSGGLLLT